MKLSISVLKLSVMKVTRISLHICISLNFAAFLCISLHFFVFLCISLDSIVVSLFTNVTHTVLDTLMVWAVTLITGSSSLPVTTVLNAQFGTCIAFKDQNDGGIQSSQCTEV